MDKVKRYEEILIAFLQSYVKEMYAQDPSEVETIIISDRDNHHYQLLRVGWTDEQHIFYCPFHFDIKKGKVWIQMNNTETLIGDELVNLGIPQSDIILAFHPEGMREYTGFAVT